MPKVSLRESKEGALLLNRPYVRSPPTANLRRWVWLNPGVGERLIELNSLSERDEGAWRDLASRALEPNPFVEPDFVLPATRTLTRGRVGLLAVEEDGDMLAALPVVRERWRRVLPALVTWRHLYSFLGSPLVDRERPEQALTELLEAARNSRRYVVLEWLSTGGPLDRALREAQRSNALQPIGEASHQRATLGRRREGDYQGHLRPHHRREMRRLGRRLEEELGAPLETVDRAGSPEAVRRFLELEASSWKGRAGTAILANPDHVRFFEEICERFARAGRLQLLELQAGERTVAGKCNLVAASGIFCFKIGHDGELGRFSPGIQLELANIERFHAGEADWMDSCAAPDNAMINRLWPDRRRIRTLVLGRPGLRTWAAERAFAMAMSRRRAQGTADAAENSS